MAYSSLPLAPLFLSKLSLAPHQLLHLPNHPALQLPKHSTFPHLHTFQALHLHTFQALQLPSHPALAPLGLASLLGPASCLWKALRKKQHNCQV